MPSAASMLVAVLLASAASPTAGARGRWMQSSSAGVFQSLKADMRPDVVAKAFARVEDEWSSQATNFAECSAVAGGSAEGCSAAARAFEESCATVAGAVVQASSGDRHAVGEYMGDVCGEPALQGWRRGRCQAFAAALAGAMTADAYDNRERLSVAGLCQSFWKRVTVEEVARAEQERKEREAEAQRQEAARAEAAKKAAEEAAAERKRQREAAKRAAEEAAAEKRRQLEEEKRLEEEKAAREAAEAKRQAEEAVKRLKAKQDEAAREAREAQQKAREAEAAAEKLRKQAVNATAAKSTTAKTTAAAKTSKGGAAASLLALGADMRPDVVAKVFAKVEDEWSAQAISFAECVARGGGAAGECSPAAAAFDKSCGTIASAVVRASSGDRNAVGEYMGDVCGEAALTGWRRGRCQSFAAALADAMSADSFDNRERLSVAGLCQGLWQRVTAEEVARAEQERKEREAEMKRQEAARVEAAKKAAEEAAAERKRQKEAAKKAAEEAKKAAEEAKRRQQEEAAREAAEAKKKAEEAVQMLKAKHAEAVKEAERAQQHAREAQAAVERLHKQAAANATAAKHNATMPASADKTSKATTKEHAPKVPSTGNTLTTAKKVASAK